MALLADDIADLVKSTLQVLGKLRFQLIAQDLTEYHVLSKLLKKERVLFDSGQRIDRNLVLDKSNVAKMTGLFAKDVVTITDLLSTMNVPWRFTTTNWGFERREILMNRSPAKIVDLITVRRTNALLSLAELMEDQFWTTPTDTEFDLYGIPYWVVKNSSTGFNGGNPPGFSDCGGIDASSKTRWRNYTFTYSAVTKADLIKKWRTAYRKINFKSPIDVRDYRTGRGSRYVLYTNETTISAIEDVGEDQNENLGRDIASMDDTITFRRHPIVYIPKLDDDSDNPIYGIDWNSFSIVCLKGDYLREEGPKQDPESHNTYAVFVDLTWNVVCVDRRRNMVAYKS